MSKTLKGKFINGRFRQIKEEPSYIKKFNTRINDGMKELANKIEKLNDSN